MILHLLEQGEEIVAWNRSEEPVKEVEPTEVQQSKAIIGAGILIFATLTFVFVIFKIATRKKQ